jgi:hypothetical protein
VATVDLYLASNHTLTRLEREIQFERLPVPGEWLRFEKSGLPPRKVSEVTHAEDGSTRVSLALARCADGSWDLYDSDAELESDALDLVNSGWRRASSVPNRAHRNDA